MAIGMNSCIDHVLHQTCFIDMHPVLIISIL